MSGNGFPVGSLRERMDPLERCPVCLRLIRIRQAPQRLPNSVQER
jgi:hypothetical protein